jgi:membrane-associated phospholipid phosphatase
MRVLKTPAGRWTLAVVASLACVALASVADGWTYHHVAMARVYDTDWGRALRTMGYWPVWAVVACAAWRHGVLARCRWLLASVTLAGLLGEVLKILVRRDRPAAEDGAYAFRAWSDHPWSSGGFGMPSSHAIEAFAAATVLAGWLPETAPLWFALAAGCALTRLLSGAHFLSDVVAGALLGVLVARALAPWGRPVDG